MNSRLCFATLALGKPYRDMAKLLAADLALHAPDHALVIATDGPDDFRDSANVVAFAHRQRGLFRCINDKRFAIGFALEKQAHEVVFVDADVRIKSRLPAGVASDARLTSVNTPRFTDQVEHWLLPRQRRAVIAAARSFGVEPGRIKFVMDFLYAVKRDHGREKVFVEVWNILTTLFDFEGISLADGYSMSIAAAVAGWTPSDTGLELFAQAMDHDFAAHQKPKPSLLARVMRRGARWSKLRAYRREVLRALKAASGP